MGIEITLNLVEAVAPKQQALQLLENLQRKGCLFQPSYDERVLLPNLESAISAGGLVISLGIEHEIILRNVYEGRPRDLPPREYGSVAAFFCPSSPNSPCGQLGLSKMLDEEDPQSWDPIAESVLDFTKIVLGVTTPVYGMLDETGENRFMSGKPMKPKHLYWRMFFGPEMVSTLGRDWLLAAPNYCLDELPNGTIVYGTEKSYMRWVAGEVSETTRDALAYFRKKFKTLTLFRAKPIDMPSFVSRMVVTNPDGTKTEVFKQEEQSSPEEPDK